LNTGRSVKWHVPTRNKTLLSWIFFWYLRNLILESIYYYTLYSAMARKFDPNTQSLLEPVPVGELKHRAIRTGALFDTSPEDTLLAAGGDGQVDVLKKYKNTISKAAYDPTNPSMESPCPKCKRQITRFLLLGESKSVVHICLCGYIWT